MPSEDKLLYRSHDIAFHLLPGRSALAYEFAFRSINKAEAIMTYFCYTCRALNNDARSAFGKVPYVHISNGNFIRPGELNECTLLHVKKFG
uniref:DSPn domain-containing protein n=1 Tax=Heterorhabditis bacteriophora TaxID=37862 RepID=A0A1I7X2J4_HETBA